MFGFSIDGDGCQQYFEDAGGDDDEDEDGDDGYGDDGEYSHANVGDDDDDDDDDDVDVDVVVFADDSVNGCGRQWDVVEIRSSDILLRSMVEAPDHTSYFLPLQ